MNGFMVASSGLLVAVTPLWLIVRRPGDGNANLLRLGIAFLSICLILCAMAVVIAPLTARAMVISACATLGALRLWRGGPCRDDALFLAAILGCAAVSAITPDTIYVPFDNYSHWSVAVRSFDEGEGLLANRHLLFPTYPPLQPLLILFLQGFVPFTTDNLQTYQVALLGYLSLLLLFGSPLHEAERGIGRRVIELLLFPLLVCIAVRTTGPLQSGYADVTAGVLIAITVAAAYHHARLASDLRLTLATLAILALPLTRPGLVLPALLLGLALVALDLWRNGLRRDMLRQRLPRYLMATAGPLAVYAAYAILMTAYYGGMQNAPIGLAESLTTLPGGDGAFRDRIHDIMVVLGRPKVLGVRVTPAVMIGAGLGGAILAVALARTRAIAAAFAAALVVLMLLWTAAVTLQMKALFALDPLLQSYARYLGIMLLPFLAGIVMLFLHPAGKWPRIVVPLGFAAATWLGLGMIERLGFWEPRTMPMQVREIAAAVRPSVGSDSVLVLTSASLPAERGTVKTRQAAFRYFLMPAVGGTAACIVAWRCDPPDAAQLAGALAARHYRWVLADHVGPAEAAALHPLVVNPAALAERGGGWTLLHVVVDPARPGGVGLVALRLPIYGDDAAKVRRVGDPG